MKTDSLMNTLTQYIDKRINEKYSNASTNKNIWRYGDYDIVMGYSDDGVALVFKESDTIKMAIGVLENKDGTPTPLMVFGAGDGNGNNRGYIQKDTDGLSMYYVGDLGLGEVSYLKLMKDKAVLNGYEVFSTASSIGDAYLASATDWNNKTQNLNSSGDATSMNIKTSSTGSRIELLDTGIFQMLNSSGQKHGLYVNANNESVSTYYNDEKGFNWFQYPGGVNSTYLAHTDNNGLNRNFMMINGHDYGYVVANPTGDWDFSYATVAGLNVSSASSHTHSIASAGTHNHGIPNGTKLATTTDGSTVSGYVTWVESGSHTHTASNAGLHSHSIS